MNITNEVIRFFNKNPTIKKVIFYTKPKFIGTPTKEHSAIVITASGDSQNKNVLIKDEKETKGSLIIGAVDTSANKIYTEIGKKDTFFDTYAKYPFSSLMWKDSKMYEDVDTKVKKTNPNYLTTYQKDYQDPHKKLEKLEQFTTGPSPLVADKKKMYTITREQYVLFLKKYFKMFELSAVHLQNEQILKNLYGLSVIDSCFVKGNAILYQNLVDNTKKIIPKDSDLYNIEVLAAMFYDVSDEHTKKFFDEALQLCDQIKQNFPDKQITSDDYFKYLDTLKIALKDGLLDL